MDAEAVQETEQPPVTYQSVAKEVFGDEYFGDEDDSETQVVEKTSEPEPLEAKPEEVEPEEDDPGEGETQPEPEVKEESEKPSQSLAELFESSGLEPNAFNDMTVDIKVDGETQAVRLGDVISQYRIDHAAEARLEKIESTKSEIEKEFSLRKDAIQQGLTDVAGLVQAAEALFLEDYQAVDWKDLKENDPTIYLVKQGEFQERLERISGIKGQAQADFQKLMESNQGQSAQELQQYAKAEQAKLFEALPDLKDDTKRQAFETELSGFLTKEMKFTAEELGDLMDSRLIVVADMAMKFHNLQKSSSAAKQKLDKAPLTLKPGAPKSRQQQATDKRAALLKRSQKTASDEDALAYLMASRGEG